MKNKIRIGNGQGFWGDSIDAPVNLVKDGPLDYLTLDYLAEVTLSIMQRQKLKNPNSGYARDFIDLIQRILPEIQENGLKVITNAGGVNPKACRKELLKISENKIKIGVIEGDDIFLGMILALFSVVFPVGKLGLYWVAAGCGPDLGSATGLLKWTHRAGKFSMAEVFALALMVVVVKTLPGDTTASVEWGAYVFVGSVIGAIFVSFDLDKTSASK